MYINVQKIDFSVRERIFQLEKLPGWVVVSLGVTHIQRSSSVAEMAGDGFVTDVREDLGHFWGEGRCTARTHDVVIVISQSLKDKRENAHL